MRTLNISNLIILISIILSNTLSAQNEIALKEIVIKPNDAKEIVEEAINKIPQNYSEHANYLKIDYQEEVKQNGITINHNKAKSLLYSQAYQEELRLKSAHKNYHDKNKLGFGDFVAARWYNELTNTDEKAKILLIEKKVKPQSDVTISGGPAGLLAYDKVKYRSHFMSQGKDKVNHHSFNNQFKSYNFKFVEETQLNNRTTYIISFNPKQSLSRRTNTFKGKMYIDVETKAFVGFDYQNVQGQTANKYGFNRQVIENQVHKVNIRYQLAQGEWQLAKIEVSDHVNVYAKNGELINQYNMISSMKVNEVINQNVLIFSPKEALANSLSSSLSAYNIPFNNVATR